MPAPWTALWVVFPLDAPPLSPQGVEPLTDSHHHQLLLGAGSGNLTCQQDFTLTGTKQHPWVGFPLLLDGSRWKKLESVSDHSPGHYLLAVSLTEASSAMSKETQPSGLLGLCSRLELSGLRIQASSSRAMF